MAQRHHLFPIPHVAISPPYLQPSSGKRKRSPSPTPDQRLEHLYSPCNADSCYHDLACGHRIKTEYLEGCGTNCTVTENRPRNAPFICQECIAIDVRLAMLMRGLSMDSAKESGNDSTMTDTADRKEMILDIATKEIKKVLDTHRTRLGVVVEKLAPKMQFWTEFHASVSEGMEQSVMQEDRPLKRPGMRYIVNTQKDTKPNSKRLKVDAPTEEDEVMNVVCEILTKIALRIK
ncbi:hypothetical protein CC78DRAFT_570260 [Lojkania enalia]|uniref:Uncharacterized protein n=1 Tax=Lojkania enalia TaxID=147567 RepID=A0A9P4K583_9PLEO|nr:hypothetical protein CC78DRAFT_570260 [Didymosphaeria enalia]